jgi:hypothetical protein
VWRPQLAGQQAVTEQFVEQVRQAHQAIEIDIHVNWNQSLTGSGKPLTQAVGSQIVGMQEIDQTQVAQSLGADPVFLARLNAWDDQRKLMLRQNFTDRVVPAHSDYRISPLEQGKRLGHKFKHL